MSIYTQEHKLFQESIRKFCEKEILPHINKWEEDKFFPSELFQKLGEQGFLGILMDEAWGGVAGDLLLAGAWTEEFGRIPAVGLSIAVNMHSLVITPTVQRLATNAIKKEWLSKAVEGKAIGAYAFTEPGAGSDLTQVRTRAVKDGDYYVLNGSKIFITNGARAHFVLVLAKTDPEKVFDGFSTFFVDTSLPGFQVARKLDKYGWHCSDTAELVLNDVRVHKSALLGKENEGWKQAMASLEWERLMLSLSAIGGAKSCLEKTITYVNERKVFGKTIGHFDHTKETLASMSARLEAARAACHKNLLLLHNKKPCRLEVSLNKIDACELAIKIADRCLQLHGGYGYTTEFLPERWLRDLRLNTIGGGTSEIMAHIALRELVGR